MTNSTDESEAGPGGTTAVSAAVSSSVTQVGQGRLTLTVEVIDPATGDLLRRAALDPIVVGESGLVQISLRTETVT